MTPVVRISEVPTPALTLYIRSLSVAGVFVLASAGIGYYTDDWHGFIPLMLAVSATVLFVWVPLRWWTTSGRLAVLYARKKGKNWKLATVLGHIRRKTIVVDRDTPALKLKSEPNPRRLDKDGNQIGYSWTLTDGTSAIVCDVDAPVTRVQHAQLASWQEQVRSSDTGTG